MIKLNIKYIKYKDSKKSKVLIFILIILVSIYISLGYFESNEVIANKVEFKNETKDMEFVLGGEACGIKLLATGVLVVEVDNKEIDLQVSDIILKIDDKTIDTNKEIIHIKKILPTPPKYNASATPDNDPTPILAAKDILKLDNGLILFLLLDLIASIIFLILN